MQGERTGRKKESGGETAGEKDRHLAVKLRKNRDGEEGRRKR